MRTIRLAPWLGVAAILQFSFGARAFAQAPAAAPPPENAAPPAPPPGYAPAPPPPGYAPPPPGYAPAPPPGYAPPGAPQAYPPPPLQQPFAGPVVTLRASAPRARLQQELQLRWVDVCTAPCGVPVSPAGVYRVGGGSYRASDPFRMPRSSGPVLIDAQVGSKPKHIVGTILMIAGIIDAAAGVIVYSAASSLSANYSSIDNGVGSKTYYEVEGAIGVITGVILMAIGIPMMASSGTSVAIR
jgi:hypothetical protein